MDFPRRSSGYFVPYTKKEAIKELLSDGRINKITSTKKGMQIITNDINPHCNGKFKKIYLAPIGQYIISIINYNGFKITIKNSLGDIKVLEGTGWDGTKFHHFHISSAFTRGICWGSVTNDIGSIKYQKDYYYGVKYCLDLIQDGNYDSDLGGDLCYMIMIIFQMRWCKLHNKPRLYDKLNKILTKHTPNWKSMVKDE